MILPFLEKETQFTFTIFPSFEVFNSVGLEYVQSQVTVASDATPQGSLRLLPVIPLTFHFGVSVDPL